MHRPVLLHEVCRFMQARPGGAYIDATVGSAGHAEKLLGGLEPPARLLALDRDADALERARVRLRRFGRQITLVQSDFKALGTVAVEHGFDAVDGILLDLGVSSDQLDNASRGFSFQQDGPLDMRMDRRQEVTAEVLVNTLSEADMKRVLWTLGEEKAAGRIARAVVRARQRAPLTGTLALAGVVAAAVGGRRGRHHPATRTFQALRMAVNHELDALETVLPEGIQRLRPGGRLVVIAFHSLEDRMVKRCFAGHVGRTESLAEGGAAWRGTLPRLRWVQRRVVRPTPAECDANPRARSARLRVVERVAL